ncbi:glycosyltransferase [Blastococcus saxobsidens]|uniref:Putative Glycosyl transferase, group 1 n=1 Tax=Blastococcus saxobsidens (strain DD2) TaxID=1146883 RepID=H6RMY0_BLASD|nr:glycosyltransferase [Blastococcus saxobsidens]CCG01333.1 Putative Glycosyl transferase, group 1 [Blastococcus saxobsidens DD2]
MTDELHVVHVINRLSPSGGAEVSLLQSLPHLRAAGIRSTVVTVHPHDRGSRVDEARSSGADVICLDAPGLLSATARFMRLLPGLQADLVHTTLFDAGVVGRVAARMRGVPAVISVVNAAYAATVGRASGGRLAGVVVKQVDRQLTRHATIGVHALSHFSASAAEETLGADPHRITVVPRGRDRAALGHPSPERRASARAALELDDTQPVVLSVGRQEGQKAHHLLVQAFTTVVAKHPRAVLVLAGRPGANTSRIESCITQADLPEGSVRVLGRRDDVGDLLCAADVFALPSLSEGLGGVVIEAMAMEAAVASFALPAVVEVLGDSGVVVPPGDVVALGDAVLSLIDDPVRRRRLVATALSRFEDNYRIETVAARMADWYRSLSHAGR